MHPVARAATFPFRAFAQRATARAAVSPVAVRRLELDDFPRVRHFLARHAAANAYLLGAIDTFGPAAFVGAHGWVALTSAADRDELLGIASFGRNVHIAWDTETRVEPPIAALARLILRDRPAALSTRAIIGPDNILEPLLYELWRMTAGPRATFPHDPTTSTSRGVLPGCGGTGWIDRGAQWLMQAGPTDLAADARSLALAPACHADLPAMLNADRAMMREELACDVDLVAPPGELRDAWCTRIDDRRAFHIRDARGQLVFKADIASLSPEVALIAGVYTVPAARRMGLARAGVGELCHFALRQAERVALAVYRNNLAAVRLYESLGFRVVGAMRSIWFV
jgi:RimJ/RimL family protein N-acetyltransferase